MYCVLDLETSGESTNKRTCNQLDPNNVVNIVAYKHQNQEAQLFYNKDDFAGGVERTNIFNHTQPCNLLIGQNFKFDLLWFWADPALREWIKNGGQVWDTQTAEYLLEGQKKEGRTLDDLAMKYGGELKDERVKSRYEEGTQTKDMDLDILLPYAKLDVINTEKVFLGQFARAKKLGMIPIIREYMHHYLAVCELEYNGLHINPDLAATMLEEGEKRFEAACDRLQELKMAGWPKELSFNPRSLDDLSNLLFGGKTKIQVPKPLLDSEGKPTVFKSGAKKGEIRTKLQEEVIRVPGLKFVPHVIWRNKKGLYLTNDEVLEVLLKEAKDHPHYAVLEALQEMREISKFKTTYLKEKDKGLLNLINEYTGCVHSNFKTAYTATGRLSSSSPNVQNLDPKALPMFMSRFEGGKIVEFDFNQFEVVLQAWLTQDKQFIKDIYDNVDFHCKRLSYLEEMPYAQVVKKCTEDPVWKEKRKKAKVVSFQKAYGASPEKISETTGLNVEEIKKIFKKEEEEYSQVAKYYKDLVADLEYTARPLKDLLSMKDKLSGVVKTVPGVFGRYSYLIDPTQKRYYLEQKGVITSRGPFLYWHLPTIQDYPIQGMASNIMASQVGQLFRWLVNSGYDKHIKIVDEVHDSIILDVDAENVPLGTILPKIKEILENVPVRYAKLFGIDINVPIEVEYSIGNSWEEAKE